jgi:hypothetical protein
MAEKVQTAVQRIQILSIQVFIQVQQGFFKSNRGTSTQNGYDYEIIIIKSDYVCGNIISSSADLIVTPQSNVGIVKTVK